MEYSEFDCRHRNLDTCKKKLTILLTSFELVAVIDRCDQYHEHLPRVMYVYVICSHPDLMDSMKSVHPTHDLLGK